VYPLHIIQCGTVIAFALYRVSLLSTATLNYLLSVLVVIKTIIPSNERVITLIASATTPPRLTTTPSVLGIARCVVRTLASFGAVRAVESR